MKGELALPRSICFRVTRLCNARCGFCLAPPDGTRHPSAEALFARIDWLLASGVRVLHFCGGEPTIHAALAASLERVHARGGSTKLTTNAIRVSDALVATLRALRTEVKVSVHGSRAHHDAIVGREAFDATVASLARMLAARVDASVQTTVVARHEEELERVVELCLDLRVRRLSVLPFLPRGSGVERRDEYALTSRERGTLRERVARLRRAHSGRLDLRWLDFTARPIHVVEPDGRIVLEGATEALDSVLGSVPEPVATSESLPSRTQLTWR